MVRTGVRVRGDGLRTGVGMRMMGAGVDFL